MNRMLLLLLALAADAAFAEAVTLQLPAQRSLAFDAPPMTKLQEVSAAERYQYLASSVGQDDARFNLSVHVEPIDCRFGRSLQEVSRCFLEKSDLISGIVKKSRNTRCDARRCEVTYTTTAQTSEREVTQLNTHALLVDRDSWVDVHLSVISPTDADKLIFARFMDSLSYAQQAANDLEAAKTPAARQEAAASGTFHLLGGGMSVTVPAEWLYRNMPVPSNPPGQTDVRIYKDDTVVAITGFPNLDGRRITEEWLKSMLVKATGLADYEDMSTEKDFNYVSLTGDDIVGGYVSFTAEAGSRPFKVLPGLESGAVTSFIVSNQQMILSISVVAEVASKADYETALRMVRSIR